MNRLVLVLVIFSQSIFSQTKTSYVNPFIGTGGHGHTFPGAVLPFGMVQLSPDTRVDGSWDGCSGYHYSDKKIYGFSHTHLSGTGCSDWGDILVMPTTGEATVDPKKYASTFSHLAEKASPGYYEVMLDEKKIKAELTVTPRVGIHRYTFQDKTEGNITLDLLHRDKTIECVLSMPDSFTVVGYRVSESWAKKQYVYFAMRFSKPYKKRDIFSAGQIIQRFGKFRIQPEGGVFSFDLSDGQPLMVKVAISPASVKGALKNLDAEAIHWDFEKYKKAAEETWEKQLNKIDIKEPDKDKRTVFYTALYHCFIHPSLSMDVDGQYRGRDGKNYTAEGFTNYSVFSLWDTYRALHPLMTILETKRTNDFINSFLVQYKHAGRLPMWELSSNETDCMIGFHSVSVIADALAKGIKGFDTDLAFNAMKAASNYSAFGIPEFNKKGYLQIDDESESVSKTLEYAYDNWCIAQTAMRLKKNEEASEFYKRSLAYVHLFDPSTGLMRPRKNGNWLSPFYPTEINNHFTEGNSWQYSFYVPHDITGLINLHKGKENLEKKLDELFSTTEKKRGRDQADVTGLVGQYAHGNEPSHHMAYLYNFVGKQDKTAARVDQLCNDFYKNSPDGLIGNEDCGQMSAWYIFSSLGMYPVCPGEPRYVLTTPQFVESTIHLENGKDVVITSNQNKSLDWIGLSYNDKPLLRTEISHEQIAIGGKLDYEYGSKEEGKSKLDAPSISLNTKRAQAAPVIISQSQVFKDSMQISISSFEERDGVLFYAIDGTSRNMGVKEYIAPFYIDSNCVVRAFLVFEGDTSAVSEGSFYKIKYNYDIGILSIANEQYAADGAQTLIDGMPADLNWRKGNWLGYQGQDFECIVDLKKKTNIQSVSVTFLQDTRSWIVFPKNFIVFTSNDKKNFKQVASIENTVKPDNNDVQVKDFTLQLPIETNAKYLKIVANSFGVLPDWHAGKGGASFIFVGEMTIK